MKVKCNECGLVLEKCLSLGCVCPKCGSSFWHRLDLEKKFDRESSEIILETYNMVKGWLEEKGYMTFGKLGVPSDPFEPSEEEKKKGLAFVIFDIVDQKKVNVRKIYLDGRIEGFEGDPCIINHIFPRMQALKYFAQNMNKEYRNFMRKCLLTDFFPTETLISLYKRFKETIEKI